MCFKKVKRRVAESMVALLVCRRVQRSVIRPLTISASIDSESTNADADCNHEDVDMRAASDSSAHMFFTRGNACICFHVCKLRSVPKLKVWTRNACHFCSSGFHLDCFVAYHFRSAIAVSNERVHAIVHQATNHYRNNDRLSRRRETSFAQKLDSVCLPSLTSPFLKKKRNVSGHGSPHVIGESCATVCDRPVFFINDDLHKSDKKSAYNLVHD